MTVTTDRRQRAMIRPVHTAELGRLWTDQARMESWRRVEVAACEEMPELLTNASGLGAPARARAARTWRRFAARASRSTRSTSASA